MAEITVVNPKFAEFYSSTASFSFLETDRRYARYALDPAITQTTLNALLAASFPTGGAAPPAGIGALVEMQGWTGIVSADAAANPYPTIKLSATTADNLLVGVISGNSGGSPLGSILANPNVGVGGQGGSQGIVNVVTEGIAVVLIDATNAVVGNVLIQSTVTAGLAHNNATVVAGQTIGTVLAAATVASGIGYTLAYIHKV